MPLPPFSELATRATINGTLDPFKILVNSAEEFLNDILQNDYRIREGISNESAPRNVDGEYVFADGVGGNEIVIGIKDYMTREKLSQYRAINAIGDAMFGDKTRDVGRELVDAIKTIFLPWVLVDVLVGLPVSADEQETMSPNHLGGFNGLPDDITYEHVNVFREYVAGKVGIDMVRKTISTRKSEVPKDLPPSNESIQRIREIFNLLFREKMLIELVRVIGELKDPSNSVPDIKALYESYVSSQRTEYATACKSLVATLYPGEEGGSQTNPDIPNIPNIRHRYYEHRPVSQNTVFAVDTKTREPNDGSTKPVKRLRTTNARYQYSNDTVAHVLLQTIQFGRWWAGMSFESVNGCLALMAGILVDFKSAEYAGFVPINVPPNGADIAHDVVVVEDTSRIKRPSGGIPRARMSAQFSLDELKNNGNLYQYESFTGRCAQYGYLKFIHLLLNAYDVTMIEKYQENDGTDMRIDIQNPTKNNIRQMMLSMDVEERNGVISGLTIFTTLCMVDGEWSVSKLNEFAMNPKSIDMVLHGGTGLAGVSPLLVRGNSMGMYGFTDKPDIVDVKITGGSAESFGPSDTFDIANPDNRQNVRISAADGTRYVPVIVWSGDMSTISRFTESVGEILGDTYVSRGALFADLVGQVMVTASKPPRILGTSIAHGLETVARTASVMIPPIAITSNLVAMPAKYIFNIAVYDEMSQYSPFGLGQIIGRPIFNGIRSAYLVVQLVSLVGMGVVQPRIVRYIDVPLRQLWSGIVELLSKDVLVRDNDLLGVKYPTRFTYIKRVDRISKYGDNNILDRSDAELIAKLVLNEYLYEAVWRSMETEWYSYNQKIVDRLRDFIETEGVSKDIKSLFENFYFAALDETVARQNSIIGNSVRIMLSNIFADSNRDLLFPDYADFIRVCSSQTKSTVDKETGEPVTYQTCTRISCERADLEAYERAFKETFPDLELDEIGLISTVRGINDRLGGDIVTGNRDLDNVIRNFPFELTDSSTDTSFQKSVIGLFDETIDEVKDLGERMLRNIMNH